MGVLTACFGPLVSGAITCARAPPIGFMTAMAIVAVVLPCRLNHNSLYFVGSTWKTACEMLATNFLDDTCELYRFTVDQGTSHDALGR